MHQVCSFGQKHVFHTVIMSHINGTTTITSISDVVNIWICGVHNYITTIFFIIIII